MNRIFPTFQSASFDAEEFADYPVDPTDSGEQAALLPFEASGFVCDEHLERQAGQGVGAFGVTDLAQDLAAVNERIAKLVLPLRGARKSGDKLAALSLPSINP